MSKNRSEVISFRLSEEEFLSYKEALKKTDLTRSEFFRQIFLDKKIVFNLKQKKSINYDKLLYEVNKIGNNVNQIAKTVNSLNYKGVLTNGLAKSINDSLLIIVTKLNDTLQEI